MTIGIYALRFIGTDKVYIGQAYNIEGKRYSTHLRSFKNKTAAKKLLRGYLEFGIPTIEILCKCSIEELNELEDKYIEKYSAVNNGFNTHKSSKDTPHGVGEDSGNSKYSNEQIVKVFFLLINLKDYTHTIINKLTGVSIDVIKGISSLKSHQWLKELYPEEYGILIKNKGTKNGSAKERGIIYPPIKDINGNIFNVENVNKFAREYNLDSSTLCKVLNGKAKSHKGWKLA